MSRRGMADATRDVVPATPAVRDGLRIAGPLVAAAAVVTFILSMSRVTFLINDDATITSIVNGDFTGRRSSSLVIAPALFGHLLRVAYAIAPGLPWYTVGLYALLIVAWAAIATAAFTLRRRPGAPAWIVVGATMLALVPSMVLRISFTPVSLMLGVAGVICFAVAARVPGRRGVVGALGAGLLLASADLVRAYSFLGVLAVFAPVIVAIALCAGIRRTAAFGATVLACVLVITATNHLEYSRSGAWRSFMKMNTARSALHNTPRLDDRNVSDADLRRIGWTRNDLHLFADFVYPDTTVYSNQDIRTLASLSPRVRNDLGVGDVLDVAKRPVVWPVVLLGIALALSRRQRAVVIATMVSVLWYAAVLVVLLLYVRLPDRVLVPLEGGAALLAGLVPHYLLGPAPLPLRPRQAIALTALVAVVAAGPAVVGLDRAWQLRSRNAAVVTWRTDLAALHAFDPHGLFVARGDLLGSWAAPFSGSSPFADPHLVPLGWPTNSPLFTARLRRLGIQDLYRAMRYNPHVYLVAPPDLVRLVEKFYAQHRGATVSFQRIKRGVLPDNSLWRAAPARS